MQHSRQSPWSAQLLPGEQVERKLGQDFKLGTFEPVRAIE